MTKKQKNGERHISYRNDICFKYACSGDDENPKAFDTPLSKQSLESILWIVRY